MQPNKGKVAYIMSRFPKITETFILYEMMAMERLGVPVEVYPFLREKTDVVHSEAEQYVERAHFGPFLLSRPILQAHLHYLRRQPRVYLDTLWTLLRANWGSARFFTRALALFPKAVYFARRMSDDGVTHVHAHFASHPAAAAFVVRRLADIPYSFTAHGSDLHRDRHMLPEKVAEAEFVVPISRYNQQMILDECGEQYRDKVVVVHCGVDTKVFKPRGAPTAHDRGEGPFTILCVGTLHEVKGQAYLIEACRLLKGEGITFICRFAGDGPDIEMLQRQAAEAGLAERVCFHGRLTREEVVELLAQADVLVAPSVPTSNGRREGIPVVLMEAMGSSVPVIASGISGIPELVEDGKCGFLVPPGDANRLAKAIEYLYHDPDLRRQFGRAGRQKVINEFDLYKNAAILARYFDLENKTWQPSSSSSGVHWH
ncbi:MAG TPA: glycosyltransferase [Anaerolineae bacterium]